MSNGQAPAYQAVPLGLVYRFEDLSALYPAEESAPEGALVLLTLHLSQPVSPAEIVHLNQDFLSHSVPPWPGNTDVVYLDPLGDTVYFEWQKGQAQLLTAILLIAAGSILPSIMTLGGLTSLIPGQSSSGSWTDIWDAMGTMMEMIGFLMLFTSMMGMLKPLASPSLRQVSSSGEPLVIETGQPQPQQRENSWSQAAKQAGISIIKAGGQYVAGKVNSSGSRQSQPGGGSTYSGGGGI